MDFRRNGGPSLAYLAEQGDAEAFLFPRPMQQSGNYDFSFSGLKTALFYRIKELGGLGNISDGEKTNLAASYQEAITDVLIEKLFKAADEYGVKEVHLAGGVSANTRLREKFFAQAEKRNLSTRIPEKITYCTDNAAMIAAAGYAMWEKTSDEQRESFSFENVAVDLAHEFRF